MRFDATQSRRSFYTILCCLWNDNHCVVLTGTKVEGECRRELTLGAHAQRGLQYLVCLSVCLSVRASSRTTGYEAANEWHQRVVNNEKMDINVAIFLKRLRSRDMA